MDFLLASDAPIQATVGGKSYSFPLWSTEELGVVLTAIRDKRVESLKKAMAADSSIKAMEKAYAVVREENSALDPYDAHVYFQTVTGVDECLLKSLAKTIPEEEARGVLKGIRYSDKQRLAIRVANIYEPVEQPKDDAAERRKHNEGRGLGDPEQKVPDQPVAMGAPQPARP